MINLVTNNLLRFLGLLLVQTLVLNNLGISFYINPYIFPFFVMALPFQTPLWLTIVIGFFAGLTLDAFNNTMGMHAAACAFIAFMRPVTLRLLTPRSSYENADQPRIHTFGLTWFIAFTGMLTLLHHLVYFYLEIFSFDNFFMTLSKVLLSAVVSTLLILLAVMIFSPGRKRT